MVESARSFFKENFALISFLIVQGIFFGGLAFGGYGYMVQLESRVATLEIRGSPHLADINTRLTTLEKVTEANKERIDSVVEIMTRELGKTVK